MSNPVNYVAVTKAVATIIFTLGALTLFVLGNIFFTKVLWIFIGVFLAVVVAGALLTNWGIYLYKCYNPEWKFDSSGWKYREGGWGE